MTKRIENISCADKQEYADILNSPSFSAYRVIRRMQSDDLSKDVDLAGMVGSLLEIGRRTKEGSMAYVEHMLINQATALQSIFTRMAERSTEQTHMPNLEAFMRMALRAQAQCRTTLETLANIKTPPVVFARQANVTTGPQQINNGTAPPSRAGGNENEPNKLLDAGTQGEAIVIDTPVETLGKIDRAEVCRR